MNMVKTDQNVGTLDTDDFEQFEDATDVRGKQVKIKQDIALDENETSESLSNQDSKTPDVIQISDANEEVKTYDRETAAKFTWQGPVSAGPYSFADSRDPIDPECPPPLYFSEEQILK